MSMTRVNLCNVRLELKKMNGLSAVRQPSHNSKACKVYSGELQSQRTLATLDNKWGPLIEFHPRLLLKLARRNARNLYTIDRWMWLDKTLSLFEKVNRYGSSGTRREPLPRHSISSITSGVVYTQPTSASHRHNCSFILPDGKIEQILNPTWFQWRFGHWIGARVTCVPVWWNFMKSSMST